MEYLFFDIECACVYKETAKICAFGYCLVDEQFHIIEKEDILINPKGKFHLTGRKGKEGIVLPYEYEAFKNYPAFPKAYEKIRGLLQGENRLVFGHATGNDVKYVNLETKRFHLPPLAYEFYDTQLIYMTKNNSYDRQYGLEYIAQDLNVDFTPHRAVDDAYATMRVAEAMCKADGVTLPQLLKKYSILAGKTKNGRMALGTSAGMRQHAEQVRLAKEKRIQTHVDFCRFVDRSRPKKKSPQMKNGEWKGKIFCFSREIENNLNTAKKYVSEIYARGGQYVFKSYHCNVFIRAEGDDSKRMQNAEGAGAEMLDEAVFIQKIAEALV